VNYFKCRQFNATFQMQKALLASVDGRLLAQSGDPLRCNDLSATGARADIAERSA